MGYSDKIASMYQKEDLTFFIVFWAVDHTEEMMISLIENPPSFWAGRESALTDARMTPGSLQCQKDE